MTLNAVTATAVTRARIEASMGAVASQVGRAVSATDPAAGTTTYAVPSRDGRDQHRVALTANAAGLSVACDCQAGRSGRACWHAGLIVLILDGECAVRVPVRRRRAA